MKIRLAIIIALFLLLFISGCGGGSGTGSVVPQAVFPSSETGSLKMQAIWPKEGEDIAAQVIQPEVVKIEIKITGDNISPPIIIYLNKGETSKIISEIPAGNIQIEFKGLDANGNVLSSRITNVTVTGGQTIPVSVILGVSILSDGFFPSTITLYKGDTLVFVNNDGLTHSFLVPELFRSGDVPAGGNFSYKFGNTSLRTYTCTREDGKILIIIIKDGDYASQPTAYPVKEIFVDDVNGDDETGNGSISKPYQHIDKGVEVANSDYTVNIINLRALPEPEGRQGYNARNDGGYYEPNTSLTLRNNLIIRKYPYDPNECMVNFYNIDASTSGAGFILSGNNTIDGIEITGVMGGSGIKASGSNCTINNCTIEGNGSCGGTKRTGITLPADSDINGGGINVDRGTCSVNNCFILDNYTISDEPDDKSKTDKKLHKSGKHERKNVYAKPSPEGLPAYGYGGGIFVNTGATCYVNSCTILVNIALFGGGIANFGTCNVTGPVEGFYIKSNKSYENQPNLIGGNYAMYGGGGIGNKGTCNLHTLILGNYAGYSNFSSPKTSRIEAQGNSIPTCFNGGGGIINIGTCNINGSIIVGNETDNFGGGICNTAYPPQIGTCTISGNTLISDNICCDGDGGGIQNIGRFTITDSTIEYNSAYNGGGGIANSYYEFDSGKVTGECTITRTIIGADTTEYGNAAEFGGGIYNEATCSLTSGVRIRHNIANDDGGGICNDPGGIINFGSAPGVIEGNLANYQGNTSGIGGGIYDNTGMSKPSSALFGNGNYSNDPPVKDNFNGAI